MHLRLIVSVAAAAWVLLLATFALSGGLAARRAPPPAVAAPAVPAVPAIPAAEPPLQSAARAAARPPAEPLNAMAGALELPITPAAPLGVGPLVPLPAGVELVWTRANFARPPHMDAGRTSTLDGALAAALPERDLASEPPARTCAVVGSSGTLLRSGYGPFIDAHEHVFRFNGAPAGGGWARDVGTRTTVSVLADVQTRQCVGGKARRIELRSAQPAQGSFEPERVERVIADCDFYGGEGNAGGILLFLPRRNGAAQLLRYAHEHSGADGPRAFVRADSFGEYVDTHIGAYAEGRSHPTSGFNGVHAALALCETLDLYGFGSPREHYFSPPREEREGAQHLYRSEHAFLLALERRFPGRVHVWR